MRTCQKNTGQSSKGIQQNPFCPDAPEEPAPGKFALVVWMHQKLWNAKYCTASFQVQTWARQWKKRWGVGGWGGGGVGERKKRDFISSGRKICSSVSHVESLVPCLWYIFSAQPELLLQNFPGQSICLKVRSLKCSSEERTDSAVWRTVI